MRKDVQEALESAIADFEKRQQAKEELDHRACEGLWLLMRRLKLMGRSQKPLLKP
jgi:hypothetical protein